ncbi:two-component regulator propeller domain-containing protein [Stigmatella sp. ncwal1]|uniref:histidine kinase n=1 Tax=Stigmatella ashevillensis TaxID=2995309 RepID=A0ABT5DBE5_9BACT|nr:two-component regulator propeller domain-containing protein [Stigmatella ashevillena]MDC0710443.1 two-component regulator propeller domain-containing protein [Stigmatella ashevillena]
MRLARGTRIPFCPGAARIAVLALLLSVGGAARALEPGKSLLQFPHTSWQRSAGLPQSAILTLAQTPDGYLWAGTWEGLARFDGVRFTIFENHTTPMLQARSIRGLATSQDGTLWLGTEAGLTGMRDGTFFPVTAPEGVVLKDLRTLLPARDGSLWIATLGHGLLHYSGGHFQAWTTRTGLVDDIVWALAESPDGTLWVGTSQGLQRWDGTALKPGPAFAPEDMEPSVRALAVDPDGHLWVGTEDGSVYRQQGGRMLREPRASMPGNQISSLLVDKDGSLWVGSTGGGLLRLANGQRSVLDGAQGLAEEAVAALLEDSEGNIWIGTEEAGLHRLKDAPLTPYGRSEGLPHDVISSIHEARDGSLWFASLGGGVTRWFGGQMTTWNTQKGLIHDRVRSIAEDNTGGLWFSTQTGLSRWQAGRFTTSLGASQGLPPGPVRTVLVDTDNFLWAGTQVGLARWNGERFELLTRKDGLPGDKITLLKHRTAGGFWVGTGGGGLAFYFRGHFTTVASEGYPMFSELSALYEEANGALWLGTDEGLFLATAGRFTRFSLAEGLFNDRIFQILPDGLGYLWMSCNKGLFRVRQAELEAVAEGRQTRVTSRAYGEDEGMRAAECNGVGGPPGIRARDGRLWFPTVRGAVVYAPTHDKPPAPLAPMRIEELRVDRQPVSLRARDIPLGDGNVEFQYTTPSLYPPQQLRFRYQLEGFDPDWVEAGSRSVAYYTNLPPGHYRFRVEAMETEDGRVAPMAEMALHLKPRFHQTRLFRGACFLAAAMLVASAMGLRLRQSRLRERELQAHVDQRTAELATLNADLRNRLQELQSTRERLVHAEKMAAVGTLAAGVGHEINNPLAFIISNLHYASMEVKHAAMQDGEPERWAEVEQALSEALLGADRVRRIVQDLKTFSRVQPERPQRVELHEVLELALSFADAEVRHRARVVKHYGPVPTVFGDEARMGQVFLNLLINAAQATPEGHADQHEIRVTTRQNEQGQAVVEVSDTGMGIPPEVLPRIFEPFFTTKPVGVGTGLGLSICHGYVQALGGDIRVHSAPGEGTTFEVTLPPAPAMAAEPAPPRPPSGSNPVWRSRLMVVDDEPLLASAMSRTLEPEHEVVPFTCARDALERLRTGEHYHLILCDLMMPEMTGMELYETLAREAPAMAERMVFITGGAFTEAARTFLDTHRLPCLDKPFDPDALRSRLRSLLAGRDSSQPATAA